MYEHPSWEEMDEGRLKNMTAPFPFVGGIMGISPTSFTFGHASHELVRWLLDCCLPSRATRNGVQLHPRKLGAEKRGIVCKHLELLAGKVSLFSKIGGPFGS